MIMSILVGVLAVSTIVGVAYRWDNLLSVVEG